MPIVIAFVFVFGVVALAASFAMRVMEARRRKQVTELLQTGNRPPAVETALLKDAGAGRLPVVEWMGAARPVAWLENRIRQAGLDWTVERFAGLAGLAAAAGAAAGFLAPVPVPAPARAAAAAALGALLPFWKLARARKKRLDAFEEQFPEALDFLARSMRAGHAFTISLELLCEEMEDPLAREIRTLFNEQNLGAPLEEALAKLVARVPLLDVRFFASAVLLQKQTGGNLNEILSRLAYVIRERFRLKGQVKAASAHGRTTAGILTALPVVTFCALFMVAPTYIQGMLADPDGQAILGGCVMAHILGTFIINKIIDIKV
jgi:tight adherence protein B